MPILHVSGHTVFFAVSLSARFTISCRVKPGRTLSTAHALFFHMAPQAAFLLPADLLSQATEALNQQITSHQATAPALFSPYAAHMLFYVVIIGFLVMLVLVGGFLVVNLGMMSKRDDDHVGGRTPSDVGVLQDMIWPQKPIPKWTLPAEPDPEEARLDAQAQLPNPHDAHEGEEPAAPTTAA
jgi:hypothetical protein